ncbi:uncharacterized protein F4807DRAFT_191686 [Annulohypoxylon truncatum]|uniref:uncharacterized protein n=1 Tax=Annulohypoxylon truncatum TaxID=327061 RepID=UPI002007E126|nr:uncharacterized protein F4807DRAFT_191686 [Annulohypoxylon truncatum]KAI1207229.1 hypothetical protein F4807DRAFT_191686 [Annulohypoxylon truncatum]
MNQNVVVPKLPAENGVHVWRTAVIMPFITFVFVAARFYCRTYVVRRSWALDDYVVAATMVAIIIHAVLMGIATYHGMGLHIWQFTPELNSQYYLWIGISSEFYVLSLAGFKSSLLLLYLQLFGVHRKFRIACYITLFYTLGYLTCNALTQFLGCHPIAKTWQSNLPGHCINTIAANIAYGAGHMTSDLIIAILPIVMVWKLQFPTTKQKIGLSLALSSGFIAWAVACVRWAISTYNQTIYDRPWWAGISFAFSIIEVNTGLICACAATFSPLFNVFTTRVRNWTNRASISWHNHSRKASVSWRNSRNEKDNPSWRAITIPDDSEPPAPPQPEHTLRMSNDSLEGSEFSLEPITTANAMPAASPDDEFAYYDLQGLQALHSGNRGMA